LLNIGFLFPLGSGVPVGLDRLIRFTRVCHRYAKGSFYIERIFKQRLRRARCSGSGPR